MNCVDVNLPVFKEAKKRLQLSDETLKKAVQAYWSETKNEDSFPDDAYVNQYLGINQTYDEKSDNQAIYDVYERQFAEPKTFTDEDKYNNYVKAAKQVFPENAVVTYTNSNNEKVVVVKRPVIVSKSNTLAHASESNVVKEQLDKVKEILLNHPQDINNEKYKNTLFEEIKKLNTYINTQYGIKALNNINGAIATNLLTIKDTEGYNTIEKLLDIERPASIDELNSLIELMQSKLKGDFTLSLENYKGEKDVIANRASGTRSLIRMHPKNNKMFEIVFDKNNLPSYEILAEEFLHPLMYTLQNRNVELFNAFLDECINSDDSVIKGIIHHINLHYKNKGNDVVANEIVTQCLAYYLKNAEKPRTTKLQQIIDKIVQLLQSVGLYNLKPDEITLKQLATALKFENVAFEIDTFESELFTHIESEAETKVTDIEQKNLFTLTPLEESESQAGIISKFVNGYIGATQNSQLGESSLFTGQAGPSFANTGNYNSESVVYVNMPDAFSSEGITECHAIFERTVDALEKGATVITDANPGYNEANPSNMLWRMYNTLEQKGYVFERVEAKKGDTSVILNTWRKGNNTVASTEINKVPETEAHSKSNIDVFKAKKEHPDLYQAEYVENGTLGKALGNTKNGKIRLNKSITVSDVINHMYGHEKGDNTTDQKKLVSEGLKDVFIDEDTLTDLLSKDSKMPYWFVYYHELSHVLNNDEAIYYNNGNDLTTSDKLAIEARATIDAWNAVIDHFNVSDFSKIPDIDTANLSYSGGRSNLHRAKKALRNKFKELRKRYSHLSSLLENNTVTHAEIKELSNGLVFTFSDVINDIMEDPNLKEDFNMSAQEKDSYLKTLKVNQLFANSIAFEPFNPKGMSRIAVINRLGINRILHDYLFPTLLSNANKTFAEMKKIKTIKDHADSLLYVAANALAVNENIHLTIGRDKSVTVSEGVKAEDAINAIRDAEGVQEMEGSLQEKWQVESRTIDVVTSMTQKVRNELSRIYKLDSNGNRVRGVFGIEQRVNVAEVSNQILNWCQGCLTVKDMVKRLEANKSKHPWLQDIINKLDNSTGEYTEFRSQFYSLFNKHLQNYSVTKTEDDTMLGGKVYKNKAANPSTVVSTAMADIVINIKAGIHPLFTKDYKLNQNNFGILQNNINYLNTVTIPKIEKSNIPIDENDAKALAYSINILGYNITPEDALKSLTPVTAKSSVDALVNIRASILKNSKRFSDWNPFVYRKENNARVDIRGNFNDLLKPFVQDIQDMMPNSIFDDGKLYQSFTVPSYVSKFMTSIHNMTKQEFGEFMNNEFGKFDFFRYQEEDSLSGYRSEWLRRLATEPNARKVMDHDVELNFDDDRYMRGMGPVKYIISLATHFFKDGAGKGEDNAVAWYRVPIMSNKPSSEFIKFYAHMGSNYRNELTDGFVELALQELTRIQTVRMQLDSWSKDLNGNKKDPKKDSRYIKSYHKNGLKFCFLDYLNPYLDGSKADTELGKLLKRKLESGNLGADENNLKLELSKVITENTEDKVSDIIRQLDRLGVLGELRNVSGIYNVNNSVEENIRKWLWNDIYGTSQILEMFVSDVAYFKDVDDLQKRLSQIHSPGLRGDVTAIDFDGKPVLSSDGKMRTILLSDFDDFVSNIKDNVSIVYDRKIASSTSDAERSYYENLKNKLCGYTDSTGKYHEGEYDKINVTDAQGYSSPTGYRKKAFMFGEWTREDEALYKSLRDGTYKPSDNVRGFQPLKPFVYTNLTKPTYLENAPMSQQKVPFSIKNSEYLLVMTDALLQGEDTGIPNMLRALFEVMEESAYDKDGNYTGKGIDTVNFESTCKTGLSGRIDLNTPVKTDANDKFKTKVITEVNGIPVERMFGEVKAKELLKRCLYNPETGEYNTNYVHEFDATDYSKQQDVPEHFKDHAQQWGSQIRMITPADLETTDSVTGETNYFEYDDYVDGKWVKTKVDATEFRIEYEKAAADNINRSLSELEDEFCLGKDYSDVERNIILSDLLQNEILENPRYGFDLYLACGLDEDGQFRMPLGDPILATRIEQLVTSMIKNRVNKQRIAGGPLVQVSNYGTSDRLNIIFKDATGNKLKTFNEFKETWKPKSKTEHAKEMNALISTYMTKDKLGRKEAERKALETLGKYDDTSTVKEAFSKYLKENQAGIAYFEVYAPVPSDEIFNTFLNPDGTVDIESIEASCPELLQMIGYRIPTEDKYSCAPLKIKGFLPKAAGEGIMLPFEITLLTGSDFDVDKEYVMRKDINIVKTPVKEAVEKLLSDYLKLNGVDESKLTKYQIKQYKDDLVTVLNNPSRTAVSKADMDIIKKYRREFIKQDKATRGRTYINNKMFDMTWSVYTHKSNADKVLNPGEFDEQKLMAFRMNAYKNTALPIEVIDTMSLDELKDLTSNNKNMLFVDTQIDFYDKNNAASAGLGMAAVQKIAHATLGGDGNYIDVNDLLHETSFTFFDKKVAGTLEIDPIKDRNGKLIGKTLGSHVAAFADAAKEPCMSLLNIDSNTFNTASAMLRLGWAFEDVALFMGQPVIADMLSELQKERISNPSTTFNKVISDRIRKIAKDNNIDSPETLLNEFDITREYLIDNVRKEPSAEDTLVILQAYKAFAKLASALRGPSFVTRFNSITTATGPTIIDNIISEYKTQYDTTGLYDADGNELDAYNIMRKHPILDSFRRSFAYTSVVLSDMPEYSRSFEGVLETMPEVLLDKVMKDRTTLKNFSDFYLSYLMVDNNIVDNNKLKYLIDKFPTEFIQKYKYSDKYSNNLLIQNIIGKTSSNSDEMTLTIPTTGMSTETKELLTSSWFDLYKKDKELAINLFEYNFFKGGMGYSPKTFMHLLPLQIRESIKGYKELYSNLEYNSNPVDIIKSFISHNTANESIFQDKKVFPIDKDDYVDIKYVNAVGSPRLTITDISSKTSGMKFASEKFKSFQNIATFKFTDNDGNVHHMFVNEGLSNEYSIVFDEIPVLGNNKSFIEIYKSGDNIGKLKPDTKVLSDTKEVDDSEFRVVDTTVEPVEENTDFSNEAEEYKRAIKVLDDEFVYKEIGSKSTKEMLSSLNIPKLLSIKDTPLIVDAINNVLQKHNISVNLEQLDKLHKKFC